MRAARPLRGCTCRGARARGYRLRKGGTQGVASARLRMPRREGSQLSTGEGPRARRGLCAVAHAEARERAAIG